MTLDIHVSRSNINLTLNGSRSTDVNTKYQQQTRCVCETQMPPIMANSKDGQGHKDKYLDTSRKILSQKMLMCNMKAFTFII